MHHSCADAHCAHDHHTLSTTTKQNQLAIALVLIGGFAVAELVVGLTSGSLALIAEAGHMASDSLALWLALLATWATQFTQRSPLSDSLADVLPAHSRSASPWETWAALINSLGLVAVAVWIGWEAIERLQAPPTAIASLQMLITAIVGLVINGVNIAILHRGSDHDLNLRGAFLHVLADTISAIGVIIAAIAVARFHWLWADGAISLFVAGLILVGALPLVRQSLTALVAQSTQSIERA